MAQKEWLAKKQRLRRGRVLRVLILKFVILKTETFSASVGVLIKSNTRREVTLGFIDAIHLREEPGSTSVGLL